MMSDRLEKIKAVNDSDFSLSNGEVNLTTCDDVAWLIEEVERLRKVESEAYEVMRTLYEETRDDIDFTDLSESLGMDDDIGTAE